MEKKHKIIGLIFGGFLALSLLFYITKSIFATVCLVGAAVLLIPPVRERVFAKTNISMTDNARTVIVVILLLFAYGAKNNKKQEVLAKQELEKSAENAAIEAKLESERIQAALKSFNASPESVLAPLRSAVHRKEWTLAIVLSKDYLTTNNKELIELHKQASTKQAAIDAASRAKKVEEDREAAVALERKKSIESQFSAWDGSHRTVEAYIKARMNNPDSYEHISTSYRDMGSYLLVSTAFRGTNAFGGVVPNHVQAKINIKTGEIIEIGHV